jgi:hypothetical protein
MNTISIKVNVEAVGRCNTTHNLSEVIQMNLSTGVYNLILVPEGDV